MNQCEHSRSLIADRGTCVVQVFRKTMCHSDACVFECLDAEYSSYRASNCAENGSIGAENVGQQRTVEQAMRWSYTKR